MTLTRSQIQVFYDHFGRKQDLQAFYEDAALDDLVSHAAFERTQCAFEFGCGTGRFAYRLLSRHLPGSASYLGVDLSGTMVDLAEQRLLPYAGRARVALSDGSLLLPLHDRSVDRLISTYVLDLLSEADIRRYISEARRVLVPDGKLCLVSLAGGISIASKIVSGLWSALFKLNPLWVGGCRPIRLTSFVDQRHWTVEYHNVVTSFGVPSEVLVACQG